MTRILSLALLVIIGFAAPAAAQTAAAQPAAEPCRAGNLTFLVPGIGPVGLEITKFEWIVPGAPSATGAPGRAGAAPAPGRGAAVNLPPYCRIDGMLDRRTGVGGKSYGIGFALALPEKWNGRFLFQGGGGLNGSVGNPLGATAAGDMNALARGFAVVSTDTGHQGSGGFDSAFMQDQQAAIDFAYAAIGRVAVVAKQLTTMYYSRPIAHSYFAGCSTGGREAMVMAQRYSREFDGIISGSPAMRTGFSNLATRSVAVALNQVAPKDASGQPIPADAFSDADKKLVIDGLKKACDANDGLADDLIFNTRACKFDPKVLACNGAKREGCLSSQQASAIEKAFTGPRDSRGTQVYPPFPYDTGITATGGGIPGLLSPGNSPLGPPNRSLQQDVDAEAAQQAANAQAILSDTASWTNLNTFAGHGGKLLFFHGMSDPWFSANDTIDYYTRLGAANGGAQQVQTWSRLFLSPGMGHCAGGQSLDSFDLLTALVDWVEKGQAPDAVIATGRAFPGRSRPLCAYPKSAFYKGSGDSQDAKNFECR
jgi:feruloyl esterase